MTLSIMTLSIKNPQYNDTEHKNFSIMTLCLKTLSIMTMTLSIKTLSIMTLSMKTLSIMTYSMTINKM